MSDSGSGAAPAPDAARMIRRRALRTARCHRPHRAPRHRPAAGDRLRNRRDHRHCGQLPSRPRPRISDRTPGHGGRGGVHGGGRWAQRVSGSPTGWARVAPGTTAGQCRGPPGCASPRRVRRGRGAISRTTAPVPPPTSGTSSFPASVSATRATSWRSNRASIHSHPVSLNSCGHVSTHEHDLLAELRKESAGALHSAIIRSHSGMTCRSARCPVPLPARRRASELGPAVHGAAPGDVPKPVPSGA